MVIEQEILRIGYLWNTLNPEVSNSLQIKTNSRRLLDNRSLNKTNDKATELFRNIIHDINATGGLIEFSDGNCAPEADPTWIDLGSRIEEIDAYLQDKNAAINIKRAKVDFPSEEAFEHF